MKKWRLAFVLAVSLTSPLPAQANSMGEMMYAMAKMMAVMMGQMMGAAMKDSSATGGFSPYMNFTSGMSAWPTAWNWPATGTLPWATNPYGSTSDPGVPGGGWGYPGSSAPYRTLQGRWVGVSGDVLDLSGNRFRLQGGQYAISGRYVIDDNHLLLYTPQSPRVTEYRFAYQGPRLALRDSYGQTLLFERVGWRAFGRH